MDKVILTKEDVEMLLAWRDSHKDLVRSLPSPIKSVEIVYDSFINIKAFRKGNTLDMYVSFLGTKLHTKFEVYAGRLKYVKGDKKWLDNEGLFSIVSVYCSLMAYMVYEKSEVVESNQTTVHQAKGVHKGHTTYILKKRYVSNGGGHHASPKGIFTVRGHYRQYKDGKRIWIKEYQKGTGDRKFKTYKI